MAALLLLKFNSVPGAVLRCNRSVKNESLPLATQAFFSCTPSSLRAAVVTPPLFVNSETTPIVNHPHHANTAPLTPSPFFLDLSRILYYTVTRSGTGL